jgi:hypothetical protein
MDLLNVLPRFIFLFLKKVLLISFDGRPGKQRVGLFEYWRVQNECKKQIHSPAMGFL